MSEHTTTGQRISAASANAIITAAIEHAESAGGAFTIAVVDDSGVLKALTRMDGAPLLSIQVAQDKAYTAVGFGMPSGGWHDFIKDDAPLALGAPTGIDRLVIFAGGFPIVLDGEIVGAVGVSGGHYSQDAAVAQAGLAAIGAQLSDG
ncbi:MAG: GlcG/HbpS family heme-binding protein [Desertimonas sp.]